LYAIKTRGDSNTDQYAISEVLYRNEKGKWVPLEYKIKEGNREKTITSKAYFKQNVHKIKIPIRKRTGKLN
jgi:hypothetical protein